MRKFWIVLLILAIFLAVGLGILWKLLGRLDAEPVLAGSILHWRVDRSYAEQRDDSVVDLVLSGRPLIMRDIVFALDRARRDAGPLSGPDRLASDGNGYGQDPPSREAVSLRVSGRQRQVLRRPVRNRCGRFFLQEGLV